MTRKKKSFDERLMNVISSNDKKTFEAMINSPEYDDSMYETVVRQICRRSKLTLFKSMHLKHKGELFKDALNASVEKSSYSIAEFILAHKMNPITKDTLDALCNAPNACLIELLMSHGLEVPTDTYLLDKTTNFDIFMWFAVNHYSEDIVNQSSNQVWKEIALDFKRNNKPYLIRFDFAKKENSYEMDLELEKAILEKDSLSAFISVLNNPKYKDNSFSVSTIVNKCCKEKDTVIIPYLFEQGYLERREYNNSIQTFIKYNRLDLIKMIFTRDFKIRKPRSVFESALCKGNEECINYIFENLTAPNPEICLGFFKNENQFMNISNKHWSNEQLLNAAKTADSKDVRYSWLKKSIIKNEMNKSFAG